MIIDSRPHAFGGIYASAICPMTAEGRIDEAALAAHLADVLGVEGVVGLLVNGHAGENAALSEAELATVVRVARQTAGGKRIIAGVSAERALTAARMAGDAAREGADAVMIVPPYSWALGADDRVVTAHHRDVAGAADLPIFLFQGAVHAGRTAFSETTLARLLEIDRVVAIKEGSWEALAYERTRRLTARLRPDVGVLASGDEHLLTCFVLGSEGSVVSLAAVLPELVVALDRAVAAGELAQAQALHGRLYDIARLVYAPPGHLAALRLKTCLQLLGRLPCVASRIPIHSLSEDETAALRQALAATGAL